MELVYEANRNITALDMENDSPLYAALPFVLVGTEPAERILAGKNVSIEYIDTFDNNWRKPESKLSIVQASGLKTVIVLTILWRIRNTGSYFIALYRIIYISFFHPAIGKAIFQRPD